MAKGRIAAKLLGKAAKSGRKTVANPRAAAREETANVGSRSVDNFVRDTATQGSRARASRVGDLEGRRARGTATSEETTELKRLDALSERDELKRRARSSASLRGRKKPADPYMDAMKALEETGEFTDDFDNLTKQQQERLIRSVMRKLTLEDPDVAMRRKLQRKLRNMEGRKMAKGGYVKKQSRGVQDFRKQGTTLSVKDNRKKKK